MAQIDCWTGRESRLLRESLRLSVRAFAEELGVAVRTVANWEAGGSATRPRPDMQAILDTALRRAPNEVQDRFTAKIGTADGQWSATNAGDPVQHKISVLADLPDDLNRRDLLRLLSLAGVLFATPQPLDWELLGDSARRDAHRTQPTLDEYERLNSHLWRVFGLSTTKAPLFPMVQAQLDVITGALQSSTSPGSRTRLCGLASDLFQLAGEILFDSDRYVEAGQCYTLAATAAREARDGDLWACALTRHAYVSLYEGEFAQAEPLLQHAALVARRGSSQLTTRHWVSSVQAQALAGLGDADACLRALDRASAVQNLTGDRPYAGWIRFDDSRLAEERGGCLVSLGEAASAESMLTLALSQGLSHRRRGAVLTDLAAAGVLLRDTDRVVRYGEAAVEVAMLTRSGALRKKLGRFQQRLALAPPNGPIEELGRRIDALSALSRE